MLKKSKFIAGIAFIAQSFTCFVMFLAYIKKKKGLGSTFLALSFVGGIAGLWLLYDEYKNMSESKLFDMESCDGDDEDCEDYEDDLLPEDDGCDDIDMSISHEGEDESAGASNDEETESQKIDE